MSAPLRGWVVALFALLALVFFPGAPAWAEDDAEAERASDAQFNSIMQQNTGEGSGALQALGYTAAASPAPAPARGPVTLPPISAGSGAGEVEVSLDAYERLRAELRARQAEDAVGYDTLVVLGASQYVGRAVPGGLSLTLTLDVTLRGPGRWKVVPLLGEEVALVGARVGGVPISVTRTGGYHVWLTQMTGEVSLTLETLVPVKGPRGSAEYDLLVARTPVTRFSCTFPTEGLEPRLSRAVRAEVVRSPGETRLDAWLAPTSRLHLVGFRELGAEEGRAAKVYAETLSLLSVGQTEVDLFTVLRYNILHAGTRQFDVLVPPGFTVVSADGEGAFRYTLDPPGPTGTLLRGETAFPIRDRYELSLRLRRELTGGAGAAFEVVPPRATGVEREYGWVGVEVIGNLKLEEVARSEVLAVDVAELPALMVQSAVSPVLRGYRYHSAGARLSLTATSLPEKEPASGSIDGVRATTVIAAEGRALTDLQITLRNRLRHSLRLRLPEGLSVRSSLLDGEPIKPSEDGQGGLLLPLKRSKGEDRLVPFTLQLVLEQDVGRFGLVGARELALPELELPASSVHWSIWLPANNDYSALESDIEPQRFTGSAEWYDTFGGGSFVGGTFVGGDTGGVLPVRVELPTGGTPLSYDRYWVAASSPVRVGLTFARGWLRAPAALLCGLLLVLGLLRASGETPTAAPARRLGLGLGLVLTGLLLAWLSSGGKVVLAGIVAGLILGARRGGWARLRAALGAWWSADAVEPPRARSWPLVGRGSRLGLLLLLGLLVFFGGLMAIRFFAVLPNVHGA